LYRSDNGGAFRLVAVLDAAVTTHTDDNDNPGALAGQTGIRHGRIASTLVVDPGMIIKSQGARIELGFGANLLAEGRDGDEIIFTSKADDRYGASGSFDTDGNGDTRGEKGDWGGFYAKPTSRLSIDEAFIAHAGGVTGVNGGTASFNAVQVHQAATRITNTRFEDNASGTGSQQGDGRDGYAPQGDATVYVNSTQPTLINNVFVDNAGAAISINTNAMGHEWKDDSGRQVGQLGAFEVSAANNGPVIQGNRLSGNELNGLEVRGEVLQTAVVWDDTDIAHVLNGTVTVPDHHTYGGLRLESSSGEALVVKVLAGGGIEATGRSLDIDDRIGGRVHVIGQPGFPVIMTSINDTSVGAGFTPEGRVQKDTRPGGGAAQSGDWQGLSFDPYSYDRNVAVYTEIEGNIGGFGDSNASLGVEESVGLLAANEKSGDENLRLGFKIHGAIAADRDVDLFSFEGAAGSVVWIDVDDTDSRLDTILELIDGAGRVLAVSQNSRQESSDGALAFVNSDLIRDGHALPMQLDHDAPENADGSYRDLYTTNDGDSGMRVVLPGVTGTRNDFFVRVRSNNLDSNVGGFQMEYAGAAPVVVGEEVVGLISGAKGVVTQVNPAAGGGTFSYVLKTQMQFSNGEDLTSHTGNSVVGVSSLVASGATRGSYQLQLRLREVDEFAGSVVRYADLRYATDAIVATGLPAHSPLTGELTHNEGQVPNGTDLYLGNFSNTDRGAVSTAGSINSLNDQDFYSFRIGRDPLATLGNEDVSVAFDIDWADGLTRPDTAIYLVQEMDANDGGGFQIIARGNDSNVADDVLTPVVPGQATTQDDLGRGSQGKRDALIGPLKLRPTVQDYGVVVVHDGQMDSRLTQFTQFDVAAGLNPAAWAATRVAPLNDTETLDLTPNQINFQFGDIPFLIVPPGQDSNIFVANPFTGRHDAIIETGTRDSYGGVAASEVRAEVLAIEALPFQAAAKTDANSDQVYTIDTEGLEAPLGETGILTFRTNGTTNEADNKGIDWRALSYGGDAEEYLYGLGERVAFNGAILDANPAIIAESPQGTLSNLIYLMDPDTGAALGRNGVTMPDGFESANPLNPFLDLDFNPLVDFDTPWAGTNVVAQVEVPEQVVSLVGFDNSLFAFTDSGNYYEYQIDRDGDLVQLPAFNPPPTATLGGGTKNLVFASVTRGPQEFGLGNRFFGIEQGSGRMYVFAPGGAAEPLMEFGREFADLDPVMVANTDPSDVAGMFFGHFQTSWTGDALGPQTNPANANDYDFLGGGHGSVQLDPIDLSGFTADDLPTFYFDYRLHSDDLNVNPDLSADTLRVSVAGDDGVWKMVATNNMNDGPAGRVWQTGGSATQTGARSPNGLAEYDPEGSRGYTNVFTQTFVQELFDDSADRQARIDLGPWAGDESVQIRIDVTTAGEARPDQTEINLLPGYQIADGHQISLTGLMPTGDQHDPLALTNVTFEFDHGLVVEMPTGAAVTEKVDLRSNGALLVTLLPDGNPSTGRPDQIVVSVDDSAAEVADKVQELLAGLLTPGQELHRSSERPSWLQVKGLADGAATFRGGSLDFADSILAEQGVAATSIAIDIEISADNTRQEVAERVQQVFADNVNFTDIGSELDSFPLVEGQNGNVGALRVYDLFVLQSGTVPAHAKPFTMIHGEFVNPRFVDPFYAYETAYPGQEFGVYELNEALQAGQRSKGVGGQSSSQNPVPAAKTGMSLGNYQFGLAERGESVVSTITTGVELDLDPDPFFEARYRSAAGNVPVAFEVKSGPYQFEVRLGRQTVDLNNILFNERLADGFNLQVDSAGSDIVDGDSFTLSNGSETVTFEFNDVSGAASGVKPGNVEVPYRRTDRPGEVADAIRNAVNLGEIRDVLQVQATSQGGRLNDSTDPVIFFHGFTAADNLGGVFFGSSNADRGDYVGLLDEKFEHNKISSAQNLNAGIWSEVAGLPTFSVDGTRDDSQVDYYSFNVGSADVTGTFEVDAAGFDPQLFLLGADGGFVNQSIPFVSSSLTHKFSEAGTYYLAIARPLGLLPAIWDVNRRGPDEPVVYPGGLANIPAGPNDLYELNIGLENKSRHFSSIVTGRDVGAGFDNGDRNRFRDQGVFIVDSNVVSFAAGDGVTIASAPTAPGARVPREGARPKAGPSQNLPLLNTENLIYGAVVQNNLLIGNGRGVVLDGDLTLGGPNIHSRLMNNTIFNSTVGIDIVDGAAPTLLNNVLIGNNTGIRGQNEGTTVLRSTVFSDNGVDVNGIGRGTEAQVDPSGPLFVNPDATGFNLAAGRPNFYPADGSAVIDQSIASQPDRSALVSIKDVIGIPPSPIVVSDRDLVGQLRENGSTSSGQGQNVNIDIGAIDRSDVTGPLATLMIPGDNDGNGIDIDPANTILQLKSGTYGYFEILVSEGSGIGPDESSIDSDRVLLVENRRRLVPDTEVVISYNSANRTLRFQSPAGLWRPDAVYEILLLNEELTLQDGTILTPVADLAGNPLQPNRPDGQSRFTIVMPEVGIDFGDAFQSSAGDDFATLREQDGARHAIIDTYDPTTQEYHLAEPRLGRYVDDDYFDSKSESQMLVLDPSDPAQFIGDDLVVTLTVDGNEQDPASDGPFTITGVPGGVETQVEIDAAAIVQAGDNLAISAAHSFVAGSDVLGQDRLVYELVAPGTQASANRIPVEIDPSDSNVDVMGKLAATLDAQLAGLNLQVSVVYTAGSNSMVLLAHDDEEGVPVGTFTGDSDDYLVFGETIVDDINELLTSEVTGFLNPLDSAGAYVDVMVTGTGFLRAWVDFDDDGEFEADELVIDDESFTNAAAGVETRRLKIETPSDALAGRRWMRYRFSQDESVLPTGLVVGGEAEDYQIDVIRMALPQANPDLFTILEDGILDTSALPINEDPIDSNDDDIPDEDELPVDVEFVIGEMPEFGTLDLDIFDFLQTGNFSYDSNDDFNGIDTFTYRIATQDSRADEDNGDFSGDYTTVTIDVLPVNDKPDASASFVTGQEDRSKVITQEDLLEAADPDNEDPSPFVLPPGSTTLNSRDVDLMNEANQTFVISGVQGDGATLITAATPATSKGTGTNDLNNLEIVESGGGLLTVTVTDNVVGDVFSLAYAGHSATFELLDVNNPEPKDGTISVFVDPASDTTDSIANRLSTKIADAFAGSDPAIDIVIEPSSPNTLELSFVTPTVDVTAIGATFGGMQVADEVNVVAGPLSGDTVSLQLGTDTIEFEMVVEGDAAAAGRVAVELLPFESLSSDAARAAAADSLMRAMNREFKSRNWGVAASIADPIAEPNKITIEETAITAGRSLSTDRGEAIALFDHAGALIELYYIGKLDYNRDNNSPALGSDATNYDALSFVATDDGISIDLHNNRFVYGDPKTADLATADIEIKPINDVPVVNADGQADLVQMEEDTLDPTVVSAQPTGWESYFTGLGLAVPVPTEDETLVIPSNFLILNDERARDSAEDETIDALETDNNDASIRVFAATAQWDTTQFGGSVTVDPVTGDVTLVPPTDWYGDIIFKYTIEDEGINESIDGTRVVSPLVSPSSEAGLVTVSLQPVNDIPVAHDREMRFTETGADVADEFVFTADDLIDPVVVAPTGPGVVGPVPLVANTPHANTLGLPTPFNEAEQQMRVVEFSNANGDTVGVVDLPTGAGNEELILNSNTGGLYVLSFTDSVFTSGKFIPSPNYNERTPFVATDGFTYRIMDDGQADASDLTGQGYMDFDQDDEISAISAPGVVTISVTETNDAPGFDIPNLTLDILERDDSLGTVIAGFADDILPGPPTAIDETTHQNVSFTVVVDASTPNDLIESALLSPTGDLTVVTYPDAVGQVTMIVTATDAPKDPSEPFTPRTTVESITINVRPVNDGPRLNDNWVDNEGFVGTDEAWSVDPENAIGEVPITYTLREDNTQAFGVMQDYTIPMNAAVGAGYQRVGLLDVFTVGPENELVDIFPGGVPFDTASEQRLELIEFGSPSELDPTVLITERGGVLVPVVDPTTGLITELSYTPPLDFNEDIGGFDSFQYTVQDNKADEGESYDLATDALFEDRLTRSNRVYLKLNAVNDRPVFTPETQEVVVLEDSAEFTRPGYSINTLGGPLLTAFDEHSQDLSFSVDLVDQPAFYSGSGLTLNDFFSIAPSIDETTGALNFKPAADVFGAFEFEVLLEDGGVDNVSRGDLNSSIPLTITIDIRPVNDPPIEDNPTDLNKQILEDSMAEWDEATLLAPFVTGPDNENFLTDGGNQTLQLAPTTFPTDSRNGGIVRYVEENGDIKLRYTPRIDFNGIDEFVYTVIDDGESIAIDGTVYSEPRIATKTVTVTVDAVNDKPRFSGAADQQHLENDGVISVSQWAKNVLPGPETATDESSQLLTFVFNMVPGSDDIFETLPAVAIDSATNAGTLNYVLKEDVSGVAVFDVTLVDDGNIDISIGDQWVSDPPRQVTITVQGVNNPPSFDLDTSSISVAEDSGPYSQAVISNISPGPADESAQTVSFDIAELTAEQAAMFAAEPTISTDGILQFTTAVHQNTVKTGPVVLSVTARDSEGAISDPVEVSIAVSEVNDAPVAVDDTLSDTDEDSVVLIPQSALLDNDIDPDLLTNDNETLTVVLSTATSAFGATLTLDSANGQIVYDPSGSLAIQALKPGEFLTDFFTYQAEDFEGLRSGFGTVSLRVDGINDAPTVVADEVDVNENGPTVINVLGNDRDVDGVIRESTVEFGLVPAFGTVSVNAQGLVTYRPFGELANNDTFTYSVKDDLGARSDTALVTISSNKPPVAEDDAAVTYVSESVLINVLENDSDADGSIDDQSVDIRITASHGTALVQADGQVLYTPVIGFVGTDSFQYQVSDNSGRVSGLATVTVEVLASRLQNAANKYDVTGDGLITPLDPLRIINFLEAANAASVPVAPGAVGPDYFDVNGDSIISVNDALLVMNQLSSLNNGSGEAAPALMPLEEEDAGLVERDREAMTFAPNDLAPTEKVMLSNCVPLVKDEVVDLLAADQDGKPEDENLKAVDEVLADLI
jgi:VCBS repeat-containing protein/parallel beta-helix repeat protein